MLSSLSNFVSKTINPHHEVIQQVQDTHQHTCIPLDECESFKLFKSKYALQHVTLSDNTQWSYYDTNSHVDIDNHNSDIPLILIPGTTGTAIVFFQQLLSLGLRGYRLISVTIPSTPTVETFIKSFNQFLQYLRVSKFHLLGTSLGGYLSLAYLSQYPHRILSLILTNAFINTRLFELNSPFYMKLFLSNDTAYNIPIPEWHLKRYIAQALPANKQKCIQISLATQFVLTQINALSKAQMSARLSLNLLHTSEPLYSNINKFDQSKITIIDAMDHNSLDSNMKNDLYNLLNHSKYSFIKAGGDFPYLSNALEYTMLIRVHLRRHCTVKIGVFDTIANVQNKPIKMSKISSDSSVRKEAKIGVFDHRRQYHNSEKASLFYNDGDNEYKYGMNEDNSDSSQSSNMEMSEMNEIKKEKSMFVNSPNANDSSPLPIMGIDEPNKAKQSQYIDKTEYFGNPNNKDSRNYSESYAVNEDKKKQYLLDRKIKQKRYKEYLVRKKKAYKKYLRHKNGINPAESDANKRHKKHKRRKHKKKRNKRSPHRNERFEARNNQSQIESVEQRKAKMLGYYHKKKEKLSENQNGNEMRLEDSTLEIESKENNELMPDILDIGSNLISPRHSFVSEEITESNNTMNNESSIESLNEEAILDKIHSKAVGKHMKRESMLDSLEIHPISEEKTALVFSDDSEQKMEIQNPPKRKKHVSRHRSVRSDANEYENDQTPMDLVSNKPRPTMIGGHRLIQSFHSIHGLDDDDNGSDGNEDEYVRYSFDERHRQDSFISELGDYGFMPSEIQPWPMEGTDNAVSGDRHMLEHGKYDSQASLMFVGHGSRANSSQDLFSEFKVDNVNDENLGDAIF